MRVLFLNPAYGENFVRVARWAAKSRGRVQRHPDYLLIAAQILIDNGHEVKFVEAAARNIPPEEVHKIAEDFKPELLVIHATTPSIYSDIEEALKIKDISGCKIVFVGQHVTAEPDDTFKISEYKLDYIIRGEYDYTLKDIANGIEPSSVLGLSWAKDKNVVHNGPREPLDVNKLPFPAWNLIKPEWYPDAGKRFPFLTLFSGRGCNNACNFCRDPRLMYGLHLRNRDAKLVADEMEFDIKTHPQIREIMFETDTFAADADHARNICNEIIKRGINKKICFSCNVRTDIDLNLLPLMKEANCRMLMVGFEFGTNEGLKSVQKGRVSVENARKFAHRAAELNFTVHGCFMFGAPGETRQSARATIDFAKSLPMDTVQFTGIAAYPGTPIYKWAKENGYLVPKDWPEWLTAQKEQRTLLNYPQLTSNDIDNLIDQGLKEFYLRPKQIWKMLTSMRNLGDLLRKFYGLKSFADYFLKKLFSDK